MITQTAANLDMTKRLDESRLWAMSLKDLQTLKRIILERAVAVFGEIGELEAEDDFARGQMARRNFRVEIIDGGRIVFRYSCEPRFADRNTFVPGAWFREYLDRLDELRLAKAQNTQTYEVRHKAELIEELTGEKCRKG